MMIRISRIHCFFCVVVLLLMAGGTYAGAVQPDDPFGFSATDHRSFCFPSDTTKNIEKHE